MKKAVVLARGASLLQFDKEKHKDSFVIAVNATIAHAKKEHGWELKPDMLYVQDQADRIRTRNRELFDAILETDIEVKLSSIASSWKGFFAKRGNAEVISGAPLTYDGDKLKAGKLFGNLSVTSAVLEAYRQGYKHIEVYGHDCDPSYKTFGRDQAVQGSSINRPHVIKKTIKELNRIHRGLKLEGGSLALASTSWLWTINAPDYEPLELDKCGEEIEEKPKPKRRSRKKKEETEE